MGPAGLEVTCRLLAAHHCLTLACLVDSMDGRHTGGDPHAVDGRAHPRGAGGGPGHHAGTISSTTPSRPLLLMMIMIMMTMMTTTHNTYIRPSIFSPSNPPPRPFQPKKGGALRRGDGRARVPPPGAPGPPRVRAGRETRAGVQGRRARLGGCVCWLFVWEGPRPPPPRWLANTVYPHTHTRRSPTASPCGPPRCSGSTPISRMTPPGSGSWPARGLTPAPRPSGYVRCIALVVVCRKALPSMWFGGVCVPQGGAVHPHPQNNPPPPLNTTTTTPSTQPPHKTDPGGLPLLLRRPARQGPAPRHPRAVRPRLPPPRRPHQRLHARLAQGPSACVLHVCEWGGLGHGLCMLRTTDNLMLVFS